MGFIIAKIDDILIESLINSSGIVNEKLPKVSATVPRLLFITPTLAYIIGSRVDSDNTAREWPAFVLAIAKTRQNMENCGA